MKYCMRVKTVQVSSIFWLIELRDISQNNTKYSIELKFIARLPASRKIYFDYRSVM